jgi:hypothetical protein
MVGILLSVIDHRLSFLGYLLLYQTQPYAQGKTEGGCGSRSGKPVDQDPRFAKNFQIFIYPIIDTQTAPHVEYPNRGSGTERGRNSYPGMNVRLHARHG